MSASKITVKYAFILGVIALVCTAISTAVYWLTKSRIESVAAAQQRESLLEVLPQSYFDNDLLATCLCNTRHCT